MAELGKRVLLTGFGPFPGVEENASGLLLDTLTLRAQETFPQATVSSLVLPTRWETAPVDLITAIEAQAPDLLLMFGVSHTADGFVIETMARNARGRHEDATGAWPATDAVCPGGPMRLGVTCPAERIAAGLSASGFAAAVSRNAGDYLCNAVLYAALTQAQGPAAGCMIGFVHLPDRFGEARGVASSKDAVNGALSIISTCMDHLDDPPAL